MKKGRGYLLILILSLNCVPTVVDGARLGIDPSTPLPSLGLPPPPEETAQLKRELETARIKLRQLSKKPPPPPPPPPGTYTDATTGMGFVSIKGGRFQMGQTETEKQQLIASEGEEWYKRYAADERRHEVTVGDFYLAKHEVTVGQWRRFVTATGYTTDAERDAGGKKGCYAYDTGDNKWDWRAGRDWKNPGFSQGDEQPVACVSFNDAQEFISWLNRTSGKKYRLPTEAQWEYAARGGTTTIRYWGDGVDEQACQYANAADKSFGSEKKFPCDDGYKYSSPVGKFKPNAYGLHDMLGNVWEWTCSSFSASYDGTEKKCAASGEGSSRVIRGGGWFNTPWFVRAAYRGGDSPAYRFGHLGFRLALPPDQR